MKAYIDTSVLVPYYYPELLSDRINAALSDLSKLAKPMISRLVEVELVSVLALKYRTGLLDREEVASVLSRFRTHLADGLYKIIAIHDRDYDLAYQWLAELRTPLRTLDALHLAAAYHNEAKLLTADRKLAESARILGVTYELFEEPSTTQQ